MHIKVHTKRGENKMGKIKKAGYTSLGSGFGLLIYGIVQLIHHDQSGITSIIAGIGIIASTFTPSNLI